MWLRCHSLTEEDVFTRYRWRNGVVRVTEFSHDDKPDIWYKSQFLNLCEHDGDRREASPALLFSGSLSADFLEEIRKMVALFELVESGVSVRVTRKFLCLFIICLLAKQRCRLQEYWSQCSNSVLKDVSRHGLYQC